MRNATAIIHVGPAAGARFTQYTAEFDARGSMGPSPSQRFVYVLVGELETGGRRLETGDFAYLPAGSNETVLAKCPASAAVIEKPYQPIADTPKPRFFTGRQSQVEPRSLMGDASLEVRMLLPDEPAFDFAVNTMTFQPGASLPMVEIHVMEHGLLMLSGGGIYRLGDHWHPVTAGDFIWMAPYCPQWFGALGKNPAQYLIYKDWNRHPLSEAR